MASRSPSCARADRCTPVAGHERRSRCEQDADGCVGGLGAVRFERQHTSIATVPRTGCAGSGRSPSICRRPVRRRTALFASAPRCPAMTASRCDGKSVQPDAPRETAKPWSARSAPGRAEHCAARRTVPTDSPPARAAPDAPGSRCARSEPGRAGGDAVVAGETARKRPPRCAQLEATFHGVTDQGDASASRLHSTD